ncbi:FAD/NAD(P)-binding domain-containing protein [Mollisia scopiformis]|uniref:FAD/NAD(P)-binding domain-containing protein n=1 Tax=Mollisia scopiformis TaxID=149040 RepID=A0A132B6Y8_MOLSC|nr:FAD/NAD(P)-binding domain-containing protein [Mollisia scopiformis]KUJ08170.1 FAD/NAD(P)-binding domain-containing protein [Mollisia scopiformis]
MTSNMKTPHVLIIGGGPGGLTLAQALRKQGASFQVFERDLNYDSRQGWAISLHWSLNELASQLPSDLGPFEETSVLKILNLQDGGSFYDSGGNKLITVGNGPKGHDDYSIRCNRSKLRAMMAQHVQIERNKKFVRYEETKDGVTAFFEDGSSASGDILVGADGVHSRVRSQLLRDNPVDPTPSPYGIITGQMVITKEQYQKELENGPSFYSTHSSKSHIFVGLKNISDDLETANYYWMYFWGDKKAAELGKKYWTQAATCEELLKLTQLVRMATPDTIMYPPLQFYQWAPYQELPPGRVTLLGDAAHPMMPFRGEGANNALLDAVRLAGQIGKHFDSGVVDWVALAKLDYEKEMLPRGADAVLKSSFISDAPAEEFRRRQQEMIERLKLGSVTSSREVM